MYQLNGKTFAAAASLPEDVLAMAHARHERPRCTCAHPAGPMYIARSAGGFVVKRMPCTAHLHAPGCQHHSQGTDKSAQDAVHSAIERDLITGQVRIRAAVAMRRSAEGKSRFGTDVHGDEKPHKRFTLRDLVLYLWNEAELTTWRPSFAGKRNWAVVRHRLLRAAANVWVNGVPLAHALFVPEPFNVPDAQGIRSRRIGCFNRFFDQCPVGERLMLLIGEVKALTNAKPEFRAVIKHLPDVIVRLPAEEPGRRMGRPQELNPSPALHHVICATFNLDANGGLAVSEFQIFPMSAQWLVALI